MKISIIIATWSTTLGLALPSGSLGNGADDSDQKNQQKPKGDPLALTGAYLAGAGISGAGLWIYHKEATKQLREKHEKAMEELRRQQNSMREHGLTKAREEAAQEAYERGKKEANPTEERHQRLLRCFEESLPIYVNDFPYRTQQEYEDLIWTLCGAKEGVELQDPAFTWGPHKTGYDLMRPRDPSTPLNEGSPPPPQGEGGTGGQQISPFTYVKNGIMNKAKTLGQNLARTASAAAKATNAGRPSTGWFGGVKAPAPAPAVKLPGRMAVSPL